MNISSVSSKNNFVLLSTEACHLCEVAESLLADLHRQMLELAEQEQFTVPEQGVFVIHKQDIANSDELIELYGEHIPVLICPVTHDALFWPFDVQQAYDFIAPKLAF